MRLTEEQLKTIITDEKHSYIDKMLDEFNIKYGIDTNQKSSLALRLKETADYALSLGITHSGLLRALLYLETCHPGFSVNPKLRMPLDSAENPEQCLRDILNMAINLSKRT